MMETLRQILPLLVSLSLAALVLAVGLNATRHDLLYMFRHPGRLARAVLAISVIPPAAAVLATSLLPLDPVSKAGVVLMAISPLPPLAPGKELRMGGSQSYAYGLFLVFALLTVVIVPLSMAIMGQIYGRDVETPVGSLVRLVLVSVLLPLVIGLAVRRVWPRIAQGLAGALSKLSMLLLIVLCVPLIVVAWPIMIAEIGDGTILAIVLIVAAALLAGEVLGGSDRGERTALAVAASLRHPGIALMLANANFQDKRVTAVILLFVLVGLIVCVPYQLWLKSRRAGPGARARRRPRLQV